MHSKSTLALLLLAAAAGVWLWKGDAWAPKVGLKPSQPELPVSAATAVLDGLSPERLTRIELTIAPDDQLVLERTDRGWRMPGNWSLRKAEVGQLVGALGNLRTRFAAIPIAETADLASYGLAAGQKQVVAKLTAGKEPISLTFGNPEPAPGETAFTRPAYVRINDLPEVLQIGPDVMPILLRPAESYRRRQLFTDVERVKLAGGGTIPDLLGPPPSESAVSVTLPGPDTETIWVSGPASSSYRLFGIPVGGTSTTFTLERIGRLPEPGVAAKGEEPATPVGRLGDAWALSAPVKDHADPARLRSLLTAVGDLWVEQFVSPTDLDRGSDIRLTTARYLAPAGPLATVPSMALVALPLPIDVRTGLKDSQHSVAVKTRAGDPVTVRFGGIARVVETEEAVAAPPPAIPGMPPPPPSTRKTVVSYRLARVDGNPQVFVVRADKYADLFTTVSKLKDPQVARFSADEVWGLEIHRAGGPDIKLRRRKGNLQAIDPADWKDRWLLEATPNPLPADADRIRELLDILAGFRGDGPDQISYPGAAPAAETVVTITARDKRAEGEPDAAARTITLRLGKPDVVNRLLPVQLQGWPRVTQVMDKFGPDDLNSWVIASFFPKTVSGLLARPPVAYRGRKLFDTADASLSSVSVSAAANGFALAKGASGEWRLTAPVPSPADPGKADQMAASLSTLEATEYLTDHPAAAELQAYGLDKPSRTVTLGFTGGRSYKLELGNARPGKPEVYARLDGGNVFGLAAATVDQLTTGILGLLPLKVWGTAPDKVTGLEITRTGDAAKQSFALTPDGTNWKLTGPFTAPVFFLNAQPLLTTLGILQAVKYQAMTVGNAADYGLDKPVLRIKLSFKEKKPVVPGSPGPSEEQMVAKTLVVGGPTPDGNRYAMLDAPNAPVFVVPAAFVVSAETPPLDLLDRSLLQLDPIRIARFQIAPEKAADAFAIQKDAAGKWRVEGLSFAVDAQRMAQLAGTASRLPVVRLADYGDAVKWADYGLDKPATAVTVTLSGDKPVSHTIALGKPALGGLRYVRVDEGKAVGLIPEDAAGRLAGQKFDYADHSLLAFDPTTLVGFNRKQGKEELELAPAATLGWDEVKPTKLKADQLYMEELADLLGRLRAERVVAYGNKAEVFKQYGLEPAAATVTLTVGDKAEQKVLRLGNPVDPAKPEGDRYAAVETPGAESIVGVVPATLVSKLLAREVAFRDHTLAKFVDADKAVFERGDRKITFTKDGVTWKVTAPLTATAESAELDGFVADLGKLRADTWVGTKAAGLKEYDLEKPVAKWQLFDGDKPVLSLLIGKKLADGRVYVATDKGELVGLLDAITSARVLAEYRQRRPWEVDAAQVEAVDIARGDVRFELRKSGPFWLDPAKPTEPIEGRAVNELLGTLGGLRVDRYAADIGADPKLYGLDNPEFRFTVTVQGGGRKVLEVGAVVGGTDGKQRYARVVDKDRTAVFVLTAADTGRLTRDRAMYVMKK